MHPAHGQSTFCRWPSLSLRNARDRRTGSSSYSKCSKQSRSHPRISTQECHFCGGPPCVSDHTGSEANNTYWHAAIQVILSLAALHEVLDGEVKHDLRTQSRRFVFTIDLGLSQHIRDSKTSLRKQPCSLEPQRPRTSNQPWSGAGFFGTRFTRLMQISFMTN